VIYALWPGKGLGGKPMRSVRMRILATVIPLWQAKEYVVAGEDVGGSQYLSDGTGVFRLWRLTWI
jgi:peptide/nickel transport system substrate-binding protein